MRETGRGRVEDSVEFAQICKCLCEIARKCVEGLCGDECCYDVMLVVRMAWNDGRRLREDRSWLWGHLGLVVGCAGEEARAAGNERGRGPRREHGDGSRMNAGRMKTSRQRRGLLPPSASAEANEEGRTGLDCTCKARRDIATAFSTTACPSSFALGTLVRHPLCAIQPPSLVMAGIMEATPASSINFDVALKTWKEVALPQLQKSMDTTALEMVELQKENMIGRKKLAEQTRDFKRLPDDATKVNAIKGLLKAYQQEIDSLTRRSQRSESTFLSVYKLLSEAPDPYPLLEAAIGQAIQVQEAVSLKTQYAGIQEENAALRAEVKALRSADEDRKKAESRLISLEERVSISPRINHIRFD